MSVGNEAKESRKERQNQIGGGMNMNKVRMNERDCVSLQIGRVNDLCPKIT